MNPITSKKTSSDLSESVTSGVRLRRGCLNPALRWPPMARTAARRRDSGDLPEAGHLPCSPTHQAGTPLNAHLHDTRDILVTQESKQRRNAAIGARAIRLATECSTQTL